MASLTAPVSLYTICSQTITAPKTYARGGVMANLMRVSPLYAWIVQKAGWDDWFDSCSFDGSCLVPNREYSALHLKSFLDRLDCESARALVRASVIPGKITGPLLAEKESVPTLGKSYLRVARRGPQVLLNNLVLEKHYCADNGNILILNGLVQPACLE